MEEREIKKINLQLFAGEGEEDNTPPENNEPTLTAEEIRAQALEQAKIEIQADMDRKAKESAEKVKVDEIKAKLDKAKSSIAKSEIKKEDSEKESLLIKISNLEQSLQEAIDIAEDFKIKYETMIEEQKVGKTKEEIRKRLDKEPYLKKTVENLLNKNLIKTIEDYDAIVDKEFKDRLKEAWDIVEKNKQAGRDFNTDYEGSKSTNKPQKINKLSEEKRKAIRLALGIRD